MATRRASRPRHGIAPVRSSAKDTLEHFTRFAGTLRLLDDQTGETRPFVLEDWQSAILGDYFAGYAETIAEVPSGSGKTTLYGAVALHHATYVRVNARVLILSASGKQAQRMWEACAGFIERSPDLSRWWIAQMYGLGRVKSLICRGVIEIVSPSPKVAEGEEPTAVLSDEVHRHADDGRAHAILASKLQKRDARILACTTAGDDEESFLGRKRHQALHTPGHLVVGHLASPPTVARPGEYYTRAVDREQLLAWHEWSLPDDVDADDLEEVKKANPASFVTLKGLRQSWTLLRTRPWDWLRQHCNRWALGESSAIDATAWRDRGDETLGPLADCRFWVGFDMGGTSDTTAVIPVWRLADDQDGLPSFVTARGVIVDPPGEGEWTLVDDVLDALDEVCGLPGTFEGLVFDRAKGGGHIAQQLERKRAFTIIDHGQSADMDDASELLATLVLEGRLRHDANERVTRQVLAAAAKRSRRHAWYLAKPASAPHRKIDAAVALAMALRVANAAKPKRKLRMTKLGA